MSEIQEPAPLKSYQLISKELLSEALKKDKGPGVELLSWKIKQFTNKGDNYASDVVGITVSYRKNEVDSECSYVAKLNPLGTKTTYTDLMEIAYIRESEVLSSIVEGMNDQLRPLGLDPIRTPKLYARYLKKGREAYINENLVTQGFKMYNRLKGMDLNHSLLVVKELGRFHASSLLFEETLPTKYIPNTFNIMKGTWFDITPEGFEMIETMFTTFGKAIGEFLKKSEPKYKKCSNWLLKHASTLVTHYNDGYKNHNKFEVLNHGDCWTNNMLFRYNEDEIPVDIRFVDLSISSKTSAASDLNFFFFTSLNGDFRQKNHNTLITAYYESFSTVLKRAGKEIPFSYLELKQELYNSKIFGMASAILVLQFTLVEGEDAPDIDFFSKDQMDKFVERQMKTFEKLSNQEGPFKDRYMAIFDEMLDNDNFNED